MAEFCSACQGRSKIRPLGGAKVYHYGLCLTNVTKGPIGPFVTLVLSFYFCLDLLWFSR